MWSLQWCPLCDSVLNLAPHIQRLGIVALACGSGEVQLHILPKPECLDMSSRDEETKLSDSGCVYR